MIRVLIVDEEAKVRRGLRMRLAIEPDVAVIGETGKAEEAPVLAQALAPDVIVVDIDTGGADGLNIVNRLREVAPEAAVVVLTLHGDENTRHRALQAGALAFLEKWGEAADLLQIIRWLAACRLLATGSGPLAARRPSVG